MMMSEIVLITFLIRYLVFGLEVIYLPHHHQRKAMFNDEGVGGETSTEHMPAIAQMSMWVNMGFDD